MQGSRGTILRGGVGALLVGILVGGLVPQAATRERVRPARPVFFQDEAGVLEEYDRRAGSIAPTPEQQAIVASLGGTARWNRFGTPISLINFDGVLARGLTGAPEDAVRAWVEQHAALFRLSESDLRGLVLQHVLPIGDDAYSVQFRQSYDGVLSTVDGRITLGIARGDLVYVSSSAAPGTEFETQPALSPRDALLAAAADVGFRIGVSDLAAARPQDDWKVFDVAGVSEPARARLRALPTPTEGTRLVYETLLIDNNHEHGHPEAWVHFVDALTGKSWRRESRIQWEREPEPPTWRVYPNIPESAAKPGERVLWCWEDNDGCERGVKNKGAFGPWDTIPNPGAPTFTTSGNAARSTQSWVSPLTPGEQYQPVSATREYDYEFTNQWFESGCNPAAFATPQRIDVDAATANLFAMHNRMHDWSYILGFTEAAYNLQVINRPESQGSGRGNDPEVGNSQSGAIFGTATPLFGRDNANQITPQDGVPPITNMYLWQPIGAAFYPPCVDGDFDMSVIGHEYTHAISNRMVAGPDAGLSGAQAGAMGESWSDLVAVEYLQQYDFAPVARENPYAVGPYVTGDNKSAIRNYAMNKSPLNYSDIAYDFVGQQVHADGEIWSAINYDIRSALVKRYNRKFPASDVSLQRRCADGRVGPARCPGNRRWTQIMFDAWLLMESNVSMVDARDAYLAADKARFGGANQKILWKVFAQGGLGVDAKSNGTGDAQPTPSFKAHRGKNATVTFRTTAPGGKKPEARIYVGHYEARATPLTEGRAGKAVMTSGTYDFIAQAPGYGMKRFRARIRSGKQTVTVRMERNLASGNNGASAAGSGQGHGALIDDTEMTAWASMEGTEVRGKFVVVDLAGGEHLIDKVQVSAMLVPGQNRFAALRQFAIELCSGKCAEASDFKRVYTSRKNAFPSRRPRPKVSDLTLRSFNIPNVRATHVRLVALHNQCTGVPAFTREDDNDATKRSSCLVGYEPLVPGQPHSVVAAELQVFGR
ncbi:MAG TPA: M36 family metallopeptidase [Actinomycetota bacterium]|nr:M36 family metallopeptidase [Actinomycetota bacterium]